MLVSDTIKNPGAKFILRFLILFLGFHYANEFYIGITAPGGYYVPFLQEHINYVAWLRHSILYGAKIVAAVFGYQSTINGPYILKSVTGAEVRMVYSCIGLGVMTFWLAFTLAHSIPWKKKVFWLSIGVLSIWIINCTRVAVIMIATIKNWNPSKYLNHHDIFNILSYILLIILMLIFIKKEGMHNTHIENPEQEDERNYQPKATAVKDLSV